jgi:transposase
MTFSETHTKNICSEIHYFEGYSLFLREHNIIQLNFEPGFHGNANDAKEMVKTYLKIKAPGKALLLVIYAEDNMFSKDAREYIASDEVSEILKADALVITGLALRIIGNGYLKINKPKRPTRLFNSETEAINWLKQYID